VRRAVLAILSAAAIACQQAPAPTAATPAPVCSAGNGNGTLICIDGNGNTVTITAPATPTPTPSSSPKCIQNAAPLYTENVVIAGRGLVASQPMAAYIDALAANLKAAGFRVAMAPAVSPDEIAVGISGFSETFDVWRADGTPHVLYIETCTPGKF